MMARRNISYLLLLIATIGLTAGCVEFKELALYDGVEPKPVISKPETIKSQVEPIIFKDRTVDMWGLEQTVCKDARLTTEYVHSGLWAMDLTWDTNVPDCKFAGVGIGWDSYAGKDLSQLMDFAAIEMYVRSKKGKMFGLPIVLTFEDYSGGMGFSYTHNKYFERTAIDEEYQRIVVPLASFDIEKENLDVTNIKQLQLELQQSGSVYIDDISLIFYEAKDENIEPWMEEEELPDPLATPINIYTDQFEHGNAWGLVSDDCKDIQETTESAFSGSKSIRLKWNEGEKCSLQAMGASWNKWKPIDMTDVIETNGFRFMVKNNGNPTSELPLFVGMEDYDRLKNKAQITTEYSKGKTFDNNWVEVIVPLSALSGPFGYHHTKQFMIFMEQSGDVYIDDIQFITIQSD